MTDIPATVTKLVQTSGNSFHAKVARWLIDQGWHVIVSPYYMDQTQNKAREIDLIAERRDWPTTDAYGHTVGDVAVRLFIECKFIASESVFWFANKDFNAARKLVCVGGTFPANNIRIGNHHYLASSQRVAKLFASDKVKNSGDHKTEHEPFYQALNQVLNAMVAMRGQPVSIPGSAPGGRGPQRVLEFPVVVCSAFDRLYSVAFDDDDDAVPGLLLDNFQLEVRYAYRDRTENLRDDYFLLDIVEFSRLDRFVKAISTDAETAAKLLSD